ncbi:MAG: CocE/NonD family hydrolase [Desulfobacterales bacterium]|nr:CocE/NonD family hydrolase [Desulfobacterales bacterium]
MENLDWHDLVSQPIYKMKVTRDVPVTMRDGVKLCVDIYAPDAPGRFPALLSYACYGKDVQKLPVAAGPVDFRTGNGGIEAGDSEYFASRGYVQVIADARGTGHSEGAYRFFSRKEQEDGYDLVEWMATQPWCDGKAGMLGLSYFAMIQYLVAALNPPHLKAIFAYDAMTDIYRHWFYHGGILNYGFLFQWWPHVPAHTIAPLGVPEAELEKMIEQARADKDVQACPVAYITLRVPERNVPLFDALLHPNDGPYYWERSAYTKFDDIKVPAYILSRWNGWGIHLPGAFSAYLGIRSPKKLMVVAEGFDRPWQADHDIILRWYDHWLKGIDTGIMDEPPIRIFTPGKNKWRLEHEWPLARTKWAKFYLRENGMLTEAAPVLNEKPDDFTNVPGLAPGQKVPSVNFETAHLAEDTEITGPIALHLFAALSAPDGDWLAEIHDIAPDGSTTLVTKGWLKASHRELDPGRSKPYQPFHPHLRRVPVVPGRITEYDLEIRETSYLFRAGHRLRLTVQGQDNGPVNGFHLPGSTESRHIIYHSADYPSYLLLPIIPGA